jgi:hypothetical protein
MYVYTPGECVDRGDPRPGLIRAEEGEAECAEQRDAGDDDADDERWLATENLHRDLSSSCGLQCLQQ